MNADFRRRSIAARAAWTTRRSAKYRATRTESASKIALMEWGKKNGWKVVFFEGTNGAPRTGIVDAVIVRIRPSDADGIDMRLVQIKAGAGGLKAREITRLKRAVERTTIGWFLAAHDGEILHFLPDDHVDGRPRRTT